MIGRIEGKLDAVAETLASHTVAAAAVSKRVTSLEDTRVRYAAYWKSLVVAGGIMLSILGKLLFFTQRVAINVPPIPLVK